MVYQRGQSFTCPRCKRESIVQLKVLFDGWTAQGEHFVCGLCGADLGENKPAAGPATAPPDAAAASRAADFLGTALPVKPRFDTKDLKKVFCRDCRHYVKHPFESRCLLRDRKVEPMSDCPSHERPATEEAADD